MPDTADKRKRCLLIAKMITWFDAEAELIPLDVDMVEKALKNYNGTDLYAIWKDVKEDFISISAFPAKFEEITRYIRYMTRVRLLLFIGSIAAMIFTLLLSFHVVRFTADPTYLIFILFIVLYAVFALNTFLNRSYNKKIVKVYTDHSGEFSGSKKKIRRAVQRLIDKLMIEIRASKLDRQKYPFEVFSTNYKNIEIVKKKGDRYKAIIAGNQKEKN